MSTRSGKRIHSSPQDEINGEYEPSCNGIKTRSKRSKKDNADEQLADKKRKKHYVKYPSEELNDDTECNDKSDPAVRKSRRNTLKERNADDIAPEEGGVRHSHKITRSTRRHEGPDGNIKAKDTGDKKKKSKKKKKAPVDNENKTHAEHQESPSKKKSNKKKNKNKSSSFRVEEVVHHKVMNTSEASTDSFHSAAGSPKYEGNCEELIMCDRKSTPGQTIHSTEIQSSPSINSSSAKNKHKHHTLTTPCEQQNGNISSDEQMETQRLRKHESSTGVPNEATDNKSSIHNLATKQSKNSRKKKISKKSLFEERSLIPNSFQNTPNGGDTTTDKKNKANRTFDKVNSTFHEEILNATFDQINKPDSIFDNNNKSNSTFDKEDVTNTTFDKEKELNGTFEKINKANSIFDMDVDINSTFNKNYKTNITFDKEDKGNTTFDSKDNCNTTFDKDDKANITFNMKDKTNTTFDKEDEANLTFDKEDTSNVTFDKENKANSTFHRKDKANTTFNKNKNTLLDERDEIDKFDTTFRKEDKGNNTFDKKDKTHNISREVKTNTTFDKEDEANTPFSKKDKTKPTFDTKDKANITFDKDDKHKSAFDTSESANKANKDRQFNKTLKVDSILSPNHRNSVIKRKSIRIESKNETNISLHNISNNNSNDSMLTYDTSKSSHVSVTSDESHTKHILNNTPLLVESSLEEEDISKCSSSPSRRDTTKPHTTPLKREGTFTKDSPDPNLSKNRKSVDKTPTRRKSLPSPGRTPFPLAKSLSKDKSILNVTRSIEKPRRSSLAETVPRATKVMFCSPSNNPGTVSQMKGKIIKSSLKGSNKSFIFEDNSCPSPPRVAGRKRSQTVDRGAGPEPQAKRSRLAEAPAAAASPRPPRLRTRTLSASAKLPEATPDAGAADSPARRTRLPNFAALHARQFARMESLDECQRRRARRARHLLTPTAPGVHRLSPTEKQAPRQPESIPSKKTETPTKAKAKATPLAGAGYSRFGFKLQADVGANPFSFTASKAAAAQAGAGPAAGPGAGLTRQATMPALAGTTRKQLARQAVMREKSFAGRRDGSRQETRTVIKGVRTNRRFELQMKMRNINA